MRNTLEFRLLCQKSAQRDAASSNMFGVLSLQLMGITQRINTVNGRKYSEDPTIFAWELCNECQSVAVAPCSALVATAHRTICVWFPSCAMHDQQDEALCYRAAQATTMS
jgi:hypothetical protein